MNSFLAQQIDVYDPALRLEEAATPPSSWYTHTDFVALENDSVFTSNWIMVARTDQLEHDGQYVAVEMCGEPIVIVRDGELRAFFNVCRHHAAVVMTGEGKVNALHCPYHGWTYNLDGSLRSTPQFSGAEKFDPSENGLKPVRVAAFEKFVFICLSEQGPDLEDYLGNLCNQFLSLGLDDLEFHQRVEYELDCNWKVFVDNFLDGGYHVPVLHKGLTNAIDYQDYTTILDDRSILQSCAMSNSAAADDTRRGNLASYFWLYPNVMFNFYDGILDTNLVVPVSETKCRVIFDYYFARDRFDEEFRQQSIEMSDQVQMEDEYICKSVQKGLQSRAYDLGRLSPEKEAGEHLFHRLLHADYSALY